MLIQKARYFGGSERRHDGAGERVAGKQTRIGLRYAAGSDVGLLHVANADAAYAGPHLLAVADGTGGLRRSLGATLYALLAGRAPRSPGREMSPTALIAYLLQLRNAPIPAIPGVPAALMAALGTALEARPSARYRTAADFRDALVAAHM